MENLKIGEKITKVPLIQGGMGVGISLGRLAGSVAKAGGIGVISTAQIGYREPDFDKHPEEANLRAIGKEMQKARQISENGIIGYNIMTALKGYADHVKAAVKAGGKVIGVDTDQAPIIDKNGEGLTITSAMKGLETTVKTALTAIKEDKWGDYAGKIDKLGLVSENTEENFVQLPVKSTQWNDGFTEENYHELVKAMYNGDIKVSDDITALPKTEIKVNDYGSIK